VPEHEQGAVGTVTAQQTWEVVYFRTTRST
jgi:hypothetical protein